MRTTFVAAAGFAAITALLATAASADVAEGWHKSMEDGLEAAKKSGKPLLVVTLWAPRV